MAELKYLETGSRIYETGVSKGVLFVMGDTGTYNQGVAWNGLTNVQESPSGAEANDQYADNIKYLSLTGAENFEGTIEAFSSPKEFDQCDGMAEIVAGANAHQQNRRPFGFAYQSIIGNEVKFNEYGTKLHLWYGCKAAPSERQHQTVSDSPEPANPSWSITSTPVDVPGFKPTSVITVDSTKVDATKWKKIIAKVYGDETGNATLPTPAEVINLLK